MISSKVKLNNTQTTLANSRAVEQSLTRTSLRNSLMALFPNFKLRQFQIKPHKAIFINLCMNYRKIRFSNPAKLGFNKIEFILLIKASLPFWSTDLTKEELGMTSKLIGRITEILDI